MLNVCFEVLNQLQCISHLSKQVQFILGGSKTTLSCLRKQSMFGGLISVIGLVSEQTQYILKSSITSLRLYFFLERILSTVIQ